VIEVTPVLGEKKLSTYGNHAGIMFRHAIGGSIPDDPTLTESIKKCNSNTQECKGDGKCLESKRNCKSSELGKLLGFSFEADLDTLNSTLHSGLKEMDQKCKGFWKGRPRFQEK